MRPGLNAFSGLLQVCCLTIAIAPSRLSAAGDELPDIRRDATVRAVEEVMPSVVNIATRGVRRVNGPLGQFYESIYGRAPASTFMSLGSGVIIDETGYLLTNEHVVRDANQIAVQFNSGTNLYYNATVVARDEKRDIALLKLDAQSGENFHAIKFARADDLLLGETVLALGNPFGLGGTVTRGILSSKSRVMPEEGALLDVPNWLQTDAPINEGNSGGPLVNLRGELIGINVAELNLVQGRPAQGIGFAVPIRLVEEALSDILPTEFVRSFWFGARVKVGTSPLVVSSVQPESPAGRAGLKPGDEVLEVNGKKPRSFIDFADLLATGAASDVRLTVKSGLEENHVSVRLVSAASVFNSDMVQAKLGLSLEALSSDEVAKRYHLNARGGFAITGVQEGSPAAAARLQSGILITSIDDETPPDVTALAKMLYRKKPGDPVHLTLSIWQRVGDITIVSQPQVTLTLR